MTVPQGCHIIWKLGWPQSSSATCGFRLPVCGIRSAVPMIHYRSCYNYKTHNCLSVSSLCPGGHTLRWPTNNLRTTWATTLAIIKTFPLFLGILVDWTLCTHMACLNNNNVLINFRARTEDGPRAPGPVPKSSIKLAKSTRTPCCNSSNRGPASQSEPVIPSVCVLASFLGFFCSFCLIYFAAPSVFPGSVSHIIRLGAMLLLFLGLYGFSCPAPWLPSTNYHLWLWLASEQKSERKPKSIWHDCHGS